MTSFYKKLYPACQLRRHLAGPSAASYQLGSPREHFLKISFPGVPGVPGPARQTLVKSVTVDFRKGVDMCDPLLYSSSCRKKQARLDIHMDWIRCIVCDDPYQVDTSSGDDYPLCCSDTCNALYVARWLM